MMSLSQVADQLHEQLKEQVLDGVEFDSALNEELMIVIQYDAQMTQGKLYSPEELLRRSLAMQLYAKQKKKTLKIDTETKLVTLE